MQEHIKKILSDLYDLDPGLIEQEGELLKLIDNFMKERPDTKFDEKFAKELRSELILKAKELSSISELKTAEIPGSVSYKVFSWPKLAYALGGAAITLILAFPFISGRAPLSEFSKVASDNTVAFKTGITKVADQAFGSLTGPANEALGLGSAESRSSVPPGAGGGGQFTAPQAAPQAEGLSFNEDMALDGDASLKKEIASSMIAPNFVNYEYVYKGEDPELTQSTLKVFKRTKSNTNAKALAGLLTGADFKLFDLGKFKDAGINSISLNEDRKFGYSVYLNMVENSLSINQNWEKWPRPDQDCRDQACFEKARLKPEDVPADEKIIAVADKFLREYEIDRSNYSEGEVQDFWRRNWELAEDKSSAWVPDQISVVYPLELDGQVVYNEGGNKTGLYVDVNIRYNKAAGIRTIVAQTYESSDYAAVIDSRQVLEAAKNGGINRVYYYDEPTRTVTVELGTPTRSLMRYYSYDQTKNESSELYVPALVFPIINRSEEVGYDQRENVIVPLAKDIFDERMVNPPIGIPEPMPLLRMESAPSIDLVPAE